MYVYLMSCKCLGHLKLSVINMLEKRATEKT